MLFFYFRNRKTGQKINFDLIMDRPQGERFINGDLFELGLETNQELADQLQAKFPIGLKISKSGNRENSEPSNHTLYLQFTVEKVTFQLFETDNFSNQVSDLYQTVYLAPATEAEEAIFLDFAAYRKKQPVVG